jgi:hypothetical protein
MDFDLKVCYLAKYLSNAASHQAAANDSHVIDART